MTKKEDFLYQVGDVGYIVAASDRTNFNCILIKRRVTLYENEYYFRFLKDRSAGWFSEEFIERRYVSYTRS